MLIYIYDLYHLMAVIISFGLPRWYLGGILMTPPDLVLAPFMAAGTVSSQAMSTDDEEWGGGVDEEKPSTIPWWFSGLIIFFGGLQNFLKMLQKNSLLQKKSENMGRRFPFVKIGS